MRAEGPTGLGGTSPPAGTSPPSLTTNASGLLTIEATCGTTHQIKALRSRKVVTWSPTPILQSAHNVVLVTDSNGNVSGRNRDERAPIESPGVRGAVIEVMNFLGADGDWYEARYDWDESGKPSVTWVNMGVRPTVAPTAADVHSYCSDNS